MYCKNCGEMLEDGAQFCTNCGTKVFIDKNVYKTAKDDKAVEDVESCASDENNNYNKSDSTTKNPSLIAENPNNHNTKSKDGRKKLIIGIVVGCILVLLASVFILNKQSVALDREVEFEGMTISVPSKWVETDNDRYEDDGSSFLDIDPSGYASYTVSDSSELTEAKNHIYIHASWGSDKDLQTAVDSDKSFITDNSDQREIYDLQDSIIEKTVIDGYETEAHVFSYKVKYDDKEFTVKDTNIYLYSSNKQFEISLYGNAIDAKKLLKTISFS